MYHFVFVAKYRRLVITEEVDELLKDICLEISKRYEVRFLEIGTEGDHVHFLIQSVPTYSPTKIVTKVKSITAQTPPNPKAFRSVDNTLNLLINSEK
jgi:putative transposase